MPRDLRLESIRDFRGGVNLRADPFELDKNESPELYNVDVDPRGGVQQRSGVTPLVTYLSNPNQLTLSEATGVNGTSGVLVDSGISSLTSEVSAEGIGGLNRVIRITASGGDAVFSVAERGVGTGVPVVAGAAYTGFSYVRGLSAARNHLVELFWFNSGGGFISSVAGTPSTGSTSEYETTFAHGIAPVGAAYVIMRVTIQGAGGGEVFRITGQQIALFYNTSAWLNPTQPLDTFDAPIVSLVPFERANTQQRQMVVATSGVNGVALWWVSFNDILGGGWAVQAIGAWDAVRGAEFGDNLYLESYPHTALRWAGGGSLGAIAPLGQAWNDDLTAPNAGDMPIAKYIAAFQGCVWVAGTKESGVEYPNRIRWSHPNFPEDWRSFDYIDIDIGTDGDIITGLMPLQDRLLVFKRKSVYVVAGSDPDTFQVFPLTREAGAISQEAIVKTDLGVYFFSWPDGIMLYDGKRLTWHFEKIRPLIDNDQIPSNAQSDITLGWSNRRLWVSTKYRATLVSPIPANNNRVFVLDPTLTKEGSWVIYDVPCGPMIDLKPAGGGADLFLTGPAGFTRLIVLETPGSTLVTDNYGGGGFGFPSSYRTRWIDLNTPAIRKRWRTPEFVVRDTGVDTDIFVEVFWDYDPTEVRRTFTLHTSEGTPGGELGKNVLVRGQPLGQARAVQLKFHGPLQKLWGVNQMSLKYTPRKLRSG